MATATKAKTTRKVKAPTVHVTLGLFDTREPIYRVKREGIPIGEFVPLNGHDYKPAGGTPLRDATARMIGHLDGLRADDRVTIGLLLDESGSMGGNEAAVIAGANQFVDGMRAVDAVDPTAAGKVLAVIVTDGYENSSREVDHVTLQKLVSDREADGWTFIFLGANIDAWGQGAALGFSGSASGQAVNYVSTPRGTYAAMSSVTADSANFLADNAAYATRRSTSALRSLSEDGSETMANTGATPDPVASAGIVDGMGSVDDALRKAKEATSR